MKLKFASLLFLLLIVAVAEVATTGVVYEYLGVWKLIGVYAITTTLGAILLLSKMSWIIRLKSKIKTCSDDAQLKNDIEIARKGKVNEVSPKYKEFITLFIHFGLWVFAWIAIIIPGIVTDLVGYVLIIIFLYRIKVIERLL